MYIYICVIRKLERERAFKEEKKENEMKMKDSNMGKDSFHSKDCHSDIKLTKNNLIATNTGGTNVYLSNIISNGEYKWKFKILKQNGIFIGVWKTNHKINVNRRISDRDNKGKCYGLMTGDRLLTWGDSEKNRKYGKACVTNDIIEMRLDLKKREIEFTLNGQSAGIAETNIEQTSYRAVVSMCDGEKLELLV